MMWMETLQTAITKKKCPTDLVMSWEVGGK